MSTSDDERVDSNTGGFNARFRTLSGRVTLSRGGSPSTPTVTLPPSPLTRRFSIKKAPQAPQAPKNLSSLAHNTLEIMAIPKHHNFPQGEASIAREKLKATLRALHITTEPFPHLKSALATLLSCFEVVEGATSNYQRQQSYTELASHLNDLAGSLGEHLGEGKSTDMQKCITKFVMSIEGQAKEIRERSRQSRLISTFNAHADEQALIGAYDRLDRMFRQLQLNVNLYTWSLASETLDLNACTLRC
ncbi:unnamed protein product [Rhizoctonia solani]|uniref:Uncharacterized protein n=1 Tax=Rhizoctonia solani TaxID=456999 RepID=A0A8H3A6S8_9AGAM|nr:unnamed protein product [Rhizoctonia solani]